MDEHDQELLDKQLRRVMPAARRDGVMILAILAIFFAGTALGGFLFGDKSEPTRMAPSNPVPAMAAPSPPPTVPQ